uniref:Uncharacterized protein n=1 Tax=Panagrellus redivivus TaxID=6233 RepID=A0A7E4UPA5_PANRE
MNGAKLARWLQSGQSSSKTVMRLVCAVSLDTREASIVDDGDHLLASCKAPDVFALAVPLDIGPAFDEIRTPMLKITIDRVVYVLKVPWTCPSIYRDKPGSEPS